MPTTTTATRSLARTAAAALAAVLLAAGSVIIAAPASAHDELVSSDPAADSALDALPAELTLTFSGELSTDPGATELQVTDAAGTSLVDGEPEVDGTVVTQPLTGAASGAVTVLWKVVSGDGHPISGELAFTVTAAPPTPIPTPSQSATVAPTETPEAEPTPTPAETPVPVSADSSGVPWILLAVLAVAVLGAVTYLLVSRARRQKALEEGAATALGGTPEGTPPADSPPPADR